MIGSRCARALGVAVILVLGLATLALAGGSRQHARFTMTEDRPGKSTGERFHVDYRNPDDPAAKPPAVRRVVTILPRGARYDPTVPASCTASDAELVAQGADACPPGSAIGGGVVTVDTGFPGPGRFVTADAEFFNNAEDEDGEFIYLNTVRDGGARTVIRADLTRRHRTTEVAMLPGTPPDGGAIDTADVRVTEVTDQGRAYIRTPRRCPADGTWATRVRFTYDDGVTQRVLTEDACRG